MQTGFSAAKKDKAQHHPEPKDRARNAPKQMPKEANAKIGVIALPALRLPVILAR